MGEWRDTTICSDPRCRARFSQTFCAAPDQELQFQGFCYVRLSKPFHEHPDTNAIRAQFRILVLLWFLTRFLHNSRSTTAISRYRAELAETILTSTLLRDCRTKTVPPLFQTTYPPTPFAASSLSPSLAPSLALVATHPHITELNGWVVGWLGGWVEG